MIYDLKTPQQIISLLENNKNVVIDFSAEWCPPCKKLFPVLEKISNLEEYKDFLFLKVDIEKFPELSPIYKIKSLPTLLLLKNSNTEGERMVGFHEEETLKKFINNFFNH